MPGRHLLDSSIVIPYRADDPEVVQQVTDADEVFVSVIVLGELLFGALKSPRPEANRA